MVFVALALAIYIYWPVALCTVTSVFAEVYPELAEEIDIEAITTNALEERQPWEELSVPARFMFSARACNAETGISSAPGWASKGLFGALAAALILFFLTKIEDRSAGTRIMNRHR